MKQLTIENELRDIVSRLICQVELATKQGRTDINLALEDAFIPILQSVYNLPHLYNLNRKQKNYPGIDLGDAHDRVAFQITSTTSLDKVKKTLQLFIDNQHYNAFDELFVLTLSAKQQTYSQPAVDKVTQNKFGFNVKDHIIDLGDILEKVTRLRIPAQQRILDEFKTILGDVDAYISFSETTVPQSQGLTSNLVPINIPQTVYVANLTIDEQSVLEGAQQCLNYKKKSASKSSLVRMALLLAGEQTTSWICHEDKLFSFLDIENSQLKNIVDIGTIETLSATDLVCSDETVNINIYKQLLGAHTRDRLKQNGIEFAVKDKFFYFTPISSEQILRKEGWIGKKKAEREVYKKVMSKKDATKVAHHKHLSFQLSFINFSDQWYASIVPSWYYTYNGHTRSNWHEKLLSQQKKLEHNQSVRNMVRFIAFFLKATNGDDSDNAIHFNELLEFHLDGGNGVAHFDAAGELSKDDASQEAAA